MPQPETRRRGKKKRDSEEVLRQKLQADELELQEEPGIRPAPEASGVSSQPGRDIEFADRSAPDDAGPGRAVLESRDKYPKGFESYVERADDKRLYAKGKIQDFLKYYRKEEERVLEFQEERRIKVKGGRMTIEFRTDNQDSLRIRMKYPNPQKPDEPFFSLITLKQESDDTISILNNDGDNGIKCWEMEALRASGMRALRKAIDPGKVFTGAGQYGKHEVAKDFIFIDLQPETSVGAIIGLENLKAQVLELDETEIGARMIKECKEILGAEGRIQWVFRSYKSGVAHSLTGDSYGDIEGSFERARAYNAIISIDPPILASVRKPGFVTLGHELNHWIRGNRSLEGQAELVRGKETKYGAGDPLEAWDDEEEAKAMMFDENSASRLLDEINYPVRLGHGSSPAQVRKAFGGKITSDALRAALQLNGLDMTSFVEANIKKLDLSQIELIELNTQIEREEEAPGGE